MPTAHRISVVNDNDVANVQPCILKSELQRYMSSRTAIVTASITEVIVDFNASIQPLGPLREAAYRLIGQAACEIDELGGRFVCRLTPTQPRIQGDELRAYFLNLVTDENLREKVNRETDRLRDVIVALAFGSLVEET
jgi:His-Xaa-Ser system protein HxsD